MSTFYNQLQALLIDGLTVAVATAITQVKVHPARGRRQDDHPPSTASMWASVGGGCGEADVIRWAGRHPGMVRRTVNRGPTDAITQSLGVCGGIKDVFVERWAPEG